MAKKKDPRLARAGVSGYNRPKRTPNHKESKEQVRILKVKKIKLERNLTMHDITHRIQILAN